MQEDPTGAALSGLQLLLVFAMCVVVTVSALATIYVVMLRPKTNPASVKGNGSGSGQLTPTAATSNAVSSRHNNRYDHGYRAPQEHPPHQEQRHNYSHNKIDCDWERTERAPLHACRAVADAPRRGHTTALLQPLFETPSSEQLVLDRTCLAATTRPQQQQHQQQNHFVSSDRLRNSEFFEIPL